MWGVGEPRKNARLDPWDSLPKLDTDFEIEDPGKAPGMVPSKRIPEDSSSWTIGDPL